MKTFLVVPVVFRVVPIPVGASLLCMGIPSTMSTVLGVISLLVRTPPLFRTVGPFRLIGGLPCGLEPGVLVFLSLGIPSCECSKRKGQ